MRFIHETYPSGGKYASRQTLAITKIEVIDLLACSDIHKLLSEYQLDGEPERKNTHMVSNTINYEVNFVFVYYLHNTDVVVKKVISQRLIFLLADCKESRVLFFECINVCVYISLVRSRA